MTEAARHLKVLCRIMPSSLADSCIIPCAEARSIIASSRSINKSYFSSRSQKFQSLQKSSFLEDSTFLKFDGILDETQSQSKLFNSWIKSSTQDLLIGKSMSVIVFGTTGSGKSYTIRGGEGKKRGQALRSVELLLNFVEKLRGKLSIKVSVLGVYEEKTIDLLQKETPASQVLISKSSDFHAALNQALKTRKNLVDKQSKDKIHMIINVQVLQDGQQLAQANFVELAGSEFAREDKTIARGFNAISCLLTNSSSTWQGNPLASLLQGSASIHGLEAVNVVLICCASQAPETFPDTLTSLKFISRIKECLERSPRPDLVHLDNLIFAMTNNKLQELEILMDHLENTVKRIALQEKPFKPDSFKKVFHDLEAEETQKNRLNDFVETKNSAELASLKVKYLQLQEMYSSAIEEKSQLTTSFAILQNQIVDDLLGQCRDLGKKFKEEQEARERFVSDLKAFRKNLMAKENKDHECSCNEDIKNLQKIIKDINEERSKLFERLENSLKENSMKEEHIQALNSNSLTYEQETQHLTSIVSEYENLIYDLRKSLNFMSNKLTLIEEEKISLFSENEKLRNSFKTLKEKIDEQQFRTDSEIANYQQDHENLIQKYEKLLEKTESLTLELTKVKLTNSHLLIQNKTLESQLQANSDFLNNKVSQVYLKLNELKSLTSRSWTTAEDF